MTLSSTVELRDLALPLDLGTYGPGDVVPERHVLDMTLTIDPSLVFIDADHMDRVFDYDPLIADIDRLAAKTHYETQEYLISRIVELCAGYHEVRAVDLTLRKMPVRNGSGSLGVRLSAGADALQALRQSMT